MLDQIFESLGSFTLLDWIGLWSGIIYVILAAKENPLCWVFGIIQCGIFAYSDFTFLKLYADGWLQLFYVAMGFWGLYLWFLAKEKSKEKIKLANWKFHLIMTLMLLVVSYFLTPYYNNFYPDASYPIIDTASTLFSIFATYLLVKKYLTNWLYWIVIDIIYVFLYYNTGAPLFALLYFIFTIVSVYGFINWRKERLKEKRYSEIN